MSTYYSAEQNVQILIALLKAHGVRKIVASPGSTNVCFVASIHHDSFFEMYSAVDERSAAYIACGLAAETGEAVALSCTQATASRNYFPALTEAYYRKLPILAITSTRATEEVGHALQQVIDRSVQPKDTVRLSVYLPVIHTEKERWACEINANKAILELWHRGGGPVHINLGTEYTNDFTAKELPAVKKIERFTTNDTLPVLAPGRVGIFVASHMEWSKELTEIVDAFCEKYDAVVHCDQTSNYRGKYGIMHRLIGSQQQYDAPCKKHSVLIHIGDMSGSAVNVKADEVWRISEDGELRDSFEKLRYVFEMDETSFFKKYLDVKVDTELSTSFYDEWRTEYDSLYKIAAEKKDEMPFSNPWIAMNTLSKLPEKSVVHYGIYNTLRSWSFFEPPKSVLGYANVGGFGIDGNISSLIGASLAHTDRLYFGIVGDLSFFYDMNSLGNRHVGKNLRIMVINNGRGTEFTIKDSFTYRAGIEPGAVSYISAEGHYGKQSRQLVKHYAEDLGFKYMTASGKDEYLNCLEQFVNPKIEEKPILFEVFTDSIDERNALDMIYNLKKSVQRQLKQAAKGILGEKGMQVAKKILKK